MQLEGKDKVPVDVMTEHRVSIHETHMSTEVCHTAQKKERKKIHEMHLTVCVCDENNTS